MNPLTLLPAAALLLATVASAQDSASLITDGDLESGSLSSGGWPVSPGVSVEEEGGNHFLRLQAEEPGKQIQAYRKLAIPAGTQKLNVSFRVRYTNITPGAQNWHTGRVVMHFKDSGGQVVKPDPAPFAFKGSSDSWVEKSVQLSVPEGAVALEFLPALFQVTQGTLELDDVVITPE